MHDRPAPGHPRGSDQRKTRRIKVFVPTEIVVEDVAVRAHLLDISESGSRVHSTIAPRTGDQAHLNLNGETHAARIVWSEAGRSGLQFTTELTPEQVARAFTR